MSILQELETTAVQYDEHVKHILSNRYILAWILKCTTSEFSKLSIKQIAEECISEDISISKVRVMPGKTNTDVEKTRERIVGTNTEDKIPGEGEIYYDMRFSAYAPDTEFLANDYSEMKKVYSIWICMNAPNYIGNAISEYSIKKSDIITGIPDNMEDYDKMSVVMICLNGTKKGREKGEGIVGLLNTLLATDIEKDEKAKILSADYGINIKDDFGEEIEHMCNLGEGIMEDAYEEGLEKGREEAREAARVATWNIIKKMLQKGIPESDILEVTDCTQETIKEVQKSMLSK